MSTNTGTATASTQSTTSSAGTTSSLPISSSVLSSISSAISSSIVAETSYTSTTTQEQSTSAVQSTSTVSLSSVAPTTQVITSVVTATGTQSGQSDSAVTVVVTRTNSATEVPVTTHISSSAGSSTTSSGAALNTGGGSGGSGSGGKGLSTAGVTAIAVVVPVVVVALLVLGAILLWRKRKQKKATEEARRKEVEDYGFNPNNDPTLPAVASESGHEMSEDNSGYRGWGAAVGSNRKMSTTLSGGHTQGQLSDAGSNPYRGPGSPNGGNSDGNSGDAMLGGANHQRRETMSSDVGSLGQGPVAGAGLAGGMKRGPSNASSTYSAGQHSDASDGQANVGSMPQSYEAYNPAAGFGYSQHGPYGDGTYGGGNDNGMPIVQDVSARRNTRIQQPGNYQQGNSGIAQNF